MKGCWWRIHRRTYVYTPLWPSSLHDSGSLRLIANGKKSQLHHLDWVPCPFIHIIFLSPWELLYTSAWAALAKHQTGGQTTDIYFSVLEAGTSKIQVLVQGPHSVPGEDALPVLQTATFSSHPHVGLAGRVPMLWSLFLFFKDTHLIMRGPPCRTASWSTDHPSKKACPSGLLPASVPLPGHVVPPVPPCPMQQRSHQLYLPDISWIWLFHNISEPPTSLDTLKIACGMRNNSCPKRSTSESPKPGTISP